MTVIRYASPADASTYGDYRVPSIPGDTRPLYRFTGRLTDDGSSGFTADPGRYHLYAGWFCPWAQRTTITLALRGLDDTVSVSYVDGARDGRGWAFRATNGHDPVNGFELLRDDAYDATEPGFDGHVSVPTLWDRRTGRVVSNDFRLIGLDLATQFAAHAAGPTTYPSDLASEIDALDAWIGPAVNKGVLAASQGDEAAREALLDAFAALDERLSTRRFLLGDRLTEADVRLWVTLARYDVRENAQREINPGLDRFPHLWGYARDLYSLPAFRRTTRFEDFRHPSAPPIEWDAPTGRSRLTDAA